MSKEIRSALTSKGQITLPVAIRKHLGVSLGQNITFIIDDTGKVEVKAPTFTLETLYGSVKPDHFPEDFKRALNEAKEEHRKRSLKKLG